MSDDWFTPEDKLLEAFVKLAIAQYRHGFLDPRDAGAAYDCTVLEPRTYEVKRDKKARRTRNAYFETRNTRQNRPSGIAATRADSWAHYLPHLGRLLVFPPRTMLAWLEDQLTQGTPGVRRTRPDGGDQNSEGIIAPVDLLLAQAFVEEVPFHVELPVQLPDLSGVGFFCPGCQRLKVVEAFAQGRCRTCRSKAAS